jgi:hypothetical protein
MRNETIGLETRCYARDPDLEAKQIIKKNMKENKEKL